MSGTTKATRKSRAPYFLVAAVVIAIALVAILSGTSRRDVPEPDRSPAGDTVQRPPVGTPPARNDIASIAERSAAMNASREARRAEHKQKLENARLAAARRFELEPVDPAWSAGKETRLQTLAEAPPYQDAGIVPDSLQIDCRSTLCKVTADHASHGASADWSMIFLTSSAGELTRSFTRTINNADGTTRVEIHAQAR